MVKGKKSAGNCKEGENKKSSHADNGIAVSNNNNKPRNLMVVDATTPLQFAWPGRFGTHHNSITVHQRSDEDTWPGGAVWDLGWCMGQLLVSIASGGGKVTTTTTTVTTSPVGEKPKTSIRTIEVPSRVSEALLLHHKNSFVECSLVLELGCGVGLTGLVAAAALRAKATVLTDLKVVIDKVTQPNVELNTSAMKQNGTTVRIMHHKGPGPVVVAMPLCWGNEQDEQAVAAVLKQLHNTRQQPTKRNARKTKCDEMSSTSPLNASTQSTSLGTITCLPDLVLIGDVAYQHKPGAPSHFEALVLTLLKFVDEHSTVMFGTRIRMPASVDLLDMLLQHFDEIAHVTADEIDATAFASVKHNMSVHFLRKKQSSE